MALIMPKKLQDAGSTNFASAEAAVPSASEELQRREAERVQEGATTHTLTTLLPYLRVFHPFPRVVFPSAEGIQFVIGLSPVWALFAKPLPMYCFADFSGHGGKSR